MAATGVKIIFLKRRLFDTVERETRGDKTAQRLNKIKGGGEIFYYLGTARGTSVARLAFLLRNIFFQLE